MRHVVVVQYPEFVGVHPSSVRDCCVRTISTAWLRGKPESTCGSTRAR
jgi:hypothetical protein